MPHTVKHVMKRVCLSLSLHFYVFHASFTTGKCRGRLFLTYERFLHLVSFSNPDCSSVVSVTFFFIFLPSLCLRVLLSDAAPSYRAAVEVKPAGGIDRGNSVGFELRGHSASAMR